MSDTATLTMHSKSACPYCDTARAFLIAHSLPYTEIKHDDRTDRQALYDRLELVAPDRTMPQIIITHAGEDHLIGGAQDLLISGVASLFKPVSISAAPAASVVVVEPDAAMPVAMDGHACCE